MTEFVSSDDPIIRSVKKSHVCLFNHKSLGQGTNFRRHKYVVIIILNGRIVFGDRSNNSPPQSLKSFIEFPTIIKHIISAIQIVRFHIGENIWTKYIAEYGE